MALVATLQMVSVWGHAQALRVAQGGQGVGGFTRLADGDHQGLGVGHAGAVAVSLATSTLQGMPAMPSSQYLAVQPL